MFKKLLISTHLVALATLINFSLLSPAIADHTNATPHGNHKAHKAAVGIHGMAIFTDGKQFFASHMPLANSIHAHQVIFSFTLDDENTDKLQSLLATNALVSLMPERFDLMKLMSGELDNFKGVLFEGHFERGGKPIVKNVEFNVTKMLLATDLITNSNDNGKFYLLNTAKNQGFLVHRIVDNPSFDQIIHVAVHPAQGTQTANNTMKPQVVTVTEGTSVSLSQPVAVKAHDKTIILKQAVYLETRDFQ